MEVFPIFFAALSVDVPNKLIYLEHWTVPQRRHSIEILMDNSQ